MAMLHSAPSLQSCCIRYFALFQDRELIIVEKQLPTKLLHKILRLRDELKICLNCCSLYSHFAKPKRCLQIADIVINDRFTVDWENTTRKFLKNFENEQAFRFAAANALEQECSSIWKSFDETTKSYFVASVDSPMSLFNASVSITVREQIGEIQLSCVDDVLWESLYGGNPFALHYWIHKAPKSQFRIDIFHLLSQVVSEKHYHMIDTLYQGFLDGKILPSKTNKDVSTAVYLLAFCPFHWQIKADQLSRLLYSLVTE